jgi:uncharacterized protein (DUF2141 family)
MFVMFNKITKVTGATACGIFALSSIALSGTALADEAPAWKAKGGTIPVTVTLKDITHLEGPIYVSIQTEKDYQSMKGFGGIIQKAELGDMTATFKVDEPGEYSVSVWHDIDDDGRFSMTKTYQILDGWGASGNAPTDRSPTFEDVKIKVESFGAAVPVTMKYPS